MAAWQVPLADIVVSDDDIGAVVAVYRSGWLSMGPETERLEAELAEYVGAAHAVAVASGTAALHLICAAVGLPPGAEVIVPSMTFVATASAILHAGARPVFAEISGRREPWLSARSAAAAVGPRTAAIMTMAYGGHAGEVEALVELARERDLVLLEDAAHALGSRWRGRCVGTFGRAGAFSFFANKNLSVGEGGAAVTDDAELAARMRLLRSHGMSSLSWDRAHGHAASYDVTEVGFNYRIDEPRAALARRRLRGLDAGNAARRRLDGRYRDLLSEIGGVEVALPPAGPLESAHHLFTIVLDEGIHREAFRSALAARSIQTSVHYPPVHRFLAFQGIPPAGPLPLTEAWGRQAVTLPLFPHMNEQQQDLVVAAIREALGSEEVLSLRA
jgi:dTDP-4-amino-4,6-dideoxygalactose transaminase